MTMKQNSFVWHVWLDAIEMSIQCHIRNKRHFSPILHRWPFRVNDTRAKWLLISYMPFKIMQWLHCTAIALNWIRNCCTLVELKLDHTENWFDWCISIANKMQFEGYRLLEMQYVNHSKSVGLSVNQSNRQYGAAAMVRYEQILKFEVCQVRRNAFSEWFFNGCAMMSMHQFSKK